jgi:hypothetical protein
VILSTSVYGRRHKQVTSTPGVAWILRFAALRSE